MKFSELKDKSGDELQTLLDQQQMAQFRLRMMKATNQLAKPHEIRAARKAVARIKTLQTQQKGQN